MTNTDLEQERSNATFNPTLLTHLLDGSSTKTIRRHHLRTLIESDPIFTNKHNAYLHRTERHILSLKKTVRLIELCRANGIYNKEDGEITSHEDFHTICMCLADDPLPTALHWIMFIPNIKALADEEQRALWLAECRDWNMIGCYAQTELGHGSNIRALETTATFRSEAECGLVGGGFVIHSPTVTSTKFWPGTLGKTANHAMVIAQLIDGEGVQHGIHNFLVPLRCKETHSLLPGVKTGDVGPKLGYNNMDNGYASFNKVVIPRRNMAMRFASVDTRGVYSTFKVSEATSKVSYITMMDVRVLIISDSSSSLSKACTIVLRYSAQRRQGFKEEDASNKQEAQVLDYTMQQYRILPLLASSYCFHFTGTIIRTTLTNMQTRLLSNQNPPTKVEMQDFHATTSALKSFCTTVSADGIEDCRKACGGHGYLVSSGLVELSQTYLSNVTVEGDNYMLPQHVIKVLIKLLPAVEQGSDRDALKKKYQHCNSYYLIDPLYDMIHNSRTKTTSSTLNSMPELAHIPFLLQAFAHRSARLLLQIYKSLGEYVTEGKTFAEAWNLCLLFMHRASRAHSLYILLHNFHQLLIAKQSNAIQDAAPLGVSEIHVLTDLAQLFGLYWIDQEPGDFLYDGYLTSQQLDTIKKCLMLKLNSVRINAIALVDAWDFSDFQLKSALGKKHGNVYEEIMESARLEPLNRREVGEGYEEYLRELIVGDVGVWKGNKGILVKEEENLVRSKL